MNVKEFLYWEKAARDTIDVKRSYLDVAGDLVAGILLSQIVYWHLPGSDGKQRLRVDAGGHKWLAKERDEWWDECRITPRQLDRALAHLEERKLIVTCVRMFGGKTVKHIRIDWDVFLKALRDVVTAQERIHKKGNRELTKREFAGYRKVNSRIDESSISITETPAETTQRSSSDAASPSAGSEPERPADPLQRVGVVNPKFAADLERKRREMRGDQT